MQSSAAAAAAAPSQLKLSPISEGPISDSMDPPGSGCQSDVYPPGGGCQYGVFVSNIHK